jgi:Fic family protein
VKPFSSHGRKSRRAVDEERRHILAILTEAKESLTRQDVRKAYLRHVGSAMAYNTVKARLEELVAEGFVERSPEGERPMAYRVFATGPAAERPASYERLISQEAEKAHDREVEIPLSPEARRLRALLERPRGERPPVGYDVGFLDAYIPGQTWYLREGERERLRELGRTAYVSQPAGTYARDIIQRLIIDLSWGSSRLEGLRYSRIDTAELLNAGRLPSGASDSDRQLILNHKAAIEFLVEEAESIAFNRYTILNLHALLAENLLADRTQEGALRTRPVAVGDSAYMPTAIPQLIEERFDKMLEKAEGISDPIEQAFFAMLHIPYLQPFIDVNKRTSRLAANIPLIRANLCPLSFVDVPEDTYIKGVLGVYEQQDISLLRDVFTWAYERSCAQLKVLREAMGDPNPIRLNYRAQLRTLVADVVRGMHWPSPETLALSAANLSVPRGDLEAVVSEAIRDLRGLRPETLGRYALRQSEFETWASAIAGIRKD